MLQIYADKTVTSCTFLQQPPFRKPFTNRDYRGSTQKNDGCPAFPPFLAVIARNSTQSLCFERHRPLCTALSAIERSKPFRAVLSVIHRFELIQALLRRFWRHSLCRQICRQKGGSDRP